MRGTNGVPSFYIAENLVETVNLFAYFIGTFNSIDSGIGIN